METKNKENQQPVGMPNDLKLSDAEGEARPPASQETCRARSVRCSAWLGIVAAGIIGVVCMCSLFRSLPYDPSWVGVLGWCWRALLGLVGTGLMALSATGLSMWPRAVEINRKYERSRRQYERQPSDKTATPEIPEPLAGLKLKSKVGSELRTDVGGIGVKQQLLIGPVIERMAPPGKEKLSKTHKEI